MFGVVSRRAARAATEEEEFSTIGHAKVSGRAFSSLVLRQPILHCREELTSLPYRNTREGVKGSSSQLPSFSVVFRPERDFSLSTADAPGASSEDTLVCLPGVSIFRGQGRHHPMFDFDGDVLPHQADLKSPGGMKSPGEEGPLSTCMAIWSFTGRRWATQPVDSNFSRAPPSARMKS